MNAGSFDPGSGQFVYNTPQNAYCVPPDAENPFPYTSNNTTNRELVVYYSPSLDQFFVYSINTNFPGIWVIPLQRNVSTGTLEVIQGADYIFDANGEIGQCHMIYIDRERNVICLVDDRDASAKVVGINADGTLNDRLALNRQFAVGLDVLVSPTPDQITVNGQLVPHDAQPFGNRLFVTLFNSDVEPGTTIPVGRVDVFDMDTFAPVATIYSRYLVGGTHSCYWEVEDQILWIIAEDTNENVSNRRNIEAVRFDGDNGGFIDSLVRIPYVETDPDDFTPSTSVYSAVHHIRAIGKAAILPQFNDGLSLVDLSRYDSLTTNTTFDSSSLTFDATDVTMDSNDPSITQVMMAEASYDVTLRESPPGGNFLQNLINTFDGCWDVRVDTESGLVMGSAGEEGVGVFLIKKGWINRWGNATGFDDLSHVSQFSGQSIGRYPSIKIADAPPRAGQNFFVFDDTSYPYDTTSELYYTTVEPTGTVQFPNSTTGFAAAYETLNFELEINEGPWNLVLPDADGKFLIPNLQADTKYYMQLFVRQVDAARGVTTQIAVSRGTWFEPLDALATSVQFAESLTIDYRNLRGINFVPTYQSQNNESFDSSIASFDSSSLTFDGGDDLIPDGTTYFDVASATALWRFYDINGSSREDVSRQLDLVKRCGFNSIRIFLSFPLWKYYRDNSLPNDLILNFQDLMGLCDSKGIYVMPVIWNDITLTEPRVGDPSYTDPLGLIDPGSSPNGVNNISAWHTDPGDTLLTAWELLSDTDWLAAEQADYIRELVAVGDQFPETLLMWDIMNEPGPASSRQSVISRTASLIKSISPTQKTTFSGVKVTNIFQTSTNLAQDSNIDVISVHPYTHSQGLLQSVIYDASYIDNSFEFPANDLGKPIIATEIGYPGVGMSYQDTINFTSNVIRPDINPNGTPAGTGTTGIGFMPWNFMIGDPNGNFPFKEGTGLVYDAQDGSGRQIVREVDAVMQFVALAQSQGYTGTATHPLFTESDLVESSATGIAGWTGHIEPAFPLAEDDQAALVTFINQDWGTMTVARYQQVSDFFVAASTQIWLDPAFLGSINNDNPYRNGITDGFQTYDPQFVTFIAQADSSTPEYAALVAQIEIDYAIATGTFDPVNDPGHLAILTDVQLRPWATLLGTYILPRVT